MKSKFIFCISLFFICTLNLNAQNNEKLDSISLLSPKHDTIPQEIAEVAAKFQGGDLIKFNKFLSTQLSLPLEANVREWSGKTYVRFIVEWDGKVKDGEAPTGTYVWKVIYQFSGKTNTSAASTTLKGTVTLIR